MQTHSDNLVITIFRQKDKLWLAIWFAGMATLWIWDAFFLNRPAFSQLRAASFSTALVGSFVVAFSFLLGWLAGLSLHFLAQARTRLPYLSLAFLLNVIRSIPQIVGILVGYVILSLLIHNEVLRGQFTQLLWMSMVVSLFVFLEVADLVQERISYYKKLDFFDAMLCCGIKESRIINLEILLKNSRAHLLHKLISVFGSAVFLLCSIDFIVSVGLSTDISLSNFPLTLGGLLAKMDSKQDILAIGTALTNIGSVPSLFFAHLQGMSTAFTIVFTLLCVYQVANGFVKRRRL